MPATIDSLKDAEKVLNLALERENGIRVFFSTKGGATKFRQRLYNRRTIDRDQAKKAYPLEHPGYGRSAWDALIVTKGEEMNQKDEVERCYLDVQRSSLEAAVGIEGIEDLGTGESVVLGEDEGE